jgi:5,10-methylenetetrahydrofolate reductase
MEKKLRVTVERQKQWKKDFVDEKISYGVDAFTITDLPFSTVLQAYWFLFALVLDYVLFLLARFLPPKLLSWWHDTDTYVFYNTQNQNQSFFSSLKLFWKIQKRLLDHEDTLVALNKTSSSVVTIAINGSSKKSVERKLIYYLSIAKEKNILGVFLVRGGGILQKYLNSIFTWPLSSSDFFSFFRDEIDKFNKKENTCLKLYAAANPNTDRETLSRLEQKHKGRNIDVLLTQPPFIWSVYEKYLENVFANESTKNISVRVGIPAIINPWNLRFWFLLVGVNWRKCKEAETLLRAFEKVWESDKSKEKLEFKNFSRDWTNSLLKRVLTRFPLVDGIHIMLMGNFITVDDILLSLGILSNPLDNTVHTKETPKFKHHFRGEVLERTFLDTAGNVTNKEVMVDVSKLENKTYKELKEISENIKSGSEVFYLEKSFVEQSKSTIWDFNYLFWESLQDFMLAHGKDYKKSIGGSPDSLDKFVERCAQGFLKNFSHKRPLHETATVVDQELVYVEVGAASTEWARKFLQKLYIYDNTLKLRYLFLDFSENVLHNAREDLGENYLGIDIEYINIGNKENKEIFNRKYFEKVSVIHVTNVYDNFPYDKYLIRGGKTYEVKTRLFIKEKSLGELAKKYQKSLRREQSIQDCLTALYLSSNARDFLSRVRQEFITEKDFYFFWQDFWNALCLEELCVQKEKSLCESVLIKNSGVSIDKNFEINTSSLVCEDFANNYTLLAPGGYMEIADIFATAVEDFKNFLGPVKYDASVATYVNLPEIEFFLKQKFSTVKFELANMSSFNGRKSQTLVTIIKE